MSVSPFSLLKSPTSKRGAQRCAMALIITARKNREASAVPPRERPVTLKRNQICNQQSRKTAPFTSCSIKFQNAAAPLFGICALRAGSSFLALDGRLSSTPPSSGDFIGTTVLRGSHLITRAWWGPTLVNYCFILQRSVSINFHPDGRVTLRERRQILGIRRVKKKRYFVNIQSRNRTDAVRVVRGEAINRLTNF